MQENKHISTGLAIAAAALLFHSAWADAFWKGTGETSEWSNAANWENYNDANWVFGGSGLQYLPQDGSIVTFGSLLSLTSGIWVQNDEKGGVNWSLSAGAPADAGLSFTTLTIGASDGTSDLGGDLAIEGGQYSASGTIIVGQKKAGRLDMKGGVLKTTGGEFWVGGANAKEDGTGTLVMTGGAITNNSTSVGWVSIGRRGVGNVELKGGSFYSEKDLTIGRYSGATGTVCVTGGRLETNAALILAQESNTKGALIVSNGVVSTKGKVYVGSAQDGLISMDGGEFNVGNEFWLGNASSSFGKFVMTNGTVNVQSYTCVGYGSGDGKFIMNGGNFVQKSNRLIVGQASNASAKGEMEMNGGYVTVPCVWVSERDAPGYIEMNGGTLTINGTDSPFCVGCGNASSGVVRQTGGTINMTANTWASLGREGNGSSGTYELSGGTFSMYADGNNGAFVVGRQGTGVLTVSGTGVLSARRIIFTENANGHATVNLNEGGTIALRFMEGTQGPTRVFNWDGGTLKAKEDNSNFIPNTIAVNLGEGGAFLDTDGHNVTIGASLSNADGLSGNGTIAKKGLGTLTISSDLDLERTFKFVIDGGVGPIALTGEGNTLGEGAKIAVAIDPVDALTNTTYVLMTGVDRTYTKETSFDLPADNGFYTFDWTLEEGVLSVTLGYKAAAPFAARYVDAGWKIYDADGVLVEAEPCVYTTYIFTGTEPSGAFETISSDYKVVLEARKGNAEDAPVENTLVFATGVNARHVTVVTDEDCKFILSASDAGLTFAAQEFVNDGNFEYADSGLELGALKLNSGVFALGGENTYLIPVPVGEGGLSIASGSVVSLDATGDVALSFNLLGSGTLRVKSGSGIAFNDTFMQDFTGTIEVPAGAWCGAEKDGNRLKTGTCKFRFTGGTAWFNGGNRNEFANDVEFVEGSSSIIQAGASSFIFEGKISGSGEFTVEVKDRGVEFSGDNHEFAGVANLNYGWAPNNMWNAFNHWNSASPNARWNLNCPYSGYYPTQGTVWRNSYALRDTSAENPMRFGSMNVNNAGTTITLNHNTYVTVGERENDTSTFNGKFVDNTVHFKKVGADSWLTLGAGFDAPAGSTFNFSAGGICFNLPADETEPTTLTNHTVTIDSSVKIRVAMTQAQYEALDLDEEYLVAKLPTNPGYKPETELLVDGTVLDTPAAAKWGVRFKSFPVVGETPAYIGAVLRRKSSGLMIIFR